MCITIYNNKNYNKLKGKVSGHITVMQIGKIVIRVSLSKHLDGYNYILGII